MKLEMNAGATSNVKEYWMWIAMVSKISIYVPRTRRRHSRAKLIPVFTRNMRLVSMIFISMLNKLQSIGNNIFCLTKYQKLKLLSNLDPCDRLICKGKNAVCQVIYETGKPFCICDKGSSGDPNHGCGKHVNFMSQIMYLSFI